MINFNKNMFFKIQYLGSTVHKAEDRYTVYVFKDKKRSYCFFPKKNNNTYWYLKVKEKNNLLYVYTICKCKDKDVFRTILPANIKLNKTINLTSTVIKAHKEVDNGVLKSSKFFIKLTRLKSPKTLNEAKKIIKNIFKDS